MMERSQRYEELEMAFLSGELTAKEAVDKVRDELKMSQEDAQEIVDFWRGEAK